MKKRTHGAPSVAITASTTLSCTTAWRGFWLPQSRWPEKRVQIQSYLYYFSLSSATATTGTAGTATSGQAGTSTSMTTGNASMGSGYVLLYQAANIDLKGLGLLSAAKEATEVGIATLEAAAARAPKPSPPTPEPVPVVPETPAPAHPQLAQIFVEEPSKEEPVVVKDVGGSSSPSFVSSSPSSSSPAIP